MQKRCVCIKNYKDYIVGDETFYTIGNRGTWFLGGSIISPFDFKKYFKPI